MHKFKLKLNRDRFEAFALLVRVSLQLYTPSTIEGKLQWILVDQLNDKLQAKLKAMAKDGKTSIQITIKPELAMAFYTWFSALHAEMSGPYQYECIVASEIYRQIDEEYA